MKPNTFHHTSALLLSLIGLASSPAFALDITGDTVTTDLTVKGGSITLNNNSSTNSSQLRFNSTNRITSSWLNAPGTWVWSHGSTPTDVMSLDSGNVLSLYDLGTSSTNPAIILNPGNSGSTPVIAPSITVGGNLVLTSSNAQTILGSQGYLRVVGGVLNLPSTTSSNSSTTGALTVAGGIGIAKDSWVNGIRIGRGAGNAPSNTALGVATLNNNTVTSGSSNGTSNTAVGYGALYENTTGWSNTATGWNAMRENTVGQRNTSLGSQSFRYQITGSHNVVLGWFAGCDLESGADLTAADESVFIGAATRAKTDGNQNSIVIGYNAIGDGSNTTVIGNSATVSTRLEGEIKVEALRISGQVIIEQPQGDISMGDYQ
jgi:hypothetical protein